MRLEPNIETHLAEPEPRRTAYRQTTGGGTAGSVTTLWKFQCKRYDRDILKEPIKCGLFTTFPLTAFLGILTRLFSVLFSLNLSTLEH